MRRLGIAVLLIGVVEGCGPSDPPPVRDELSDPCRSTRRRCVDDDTVLVCHDRVWTIRDCDEVCWEQDVDLVSRGCVPAERDWMRDDCTCVPADGPQCEPGERTCVDDETLSVCTAHAVWEQRACTELCSAGPIPLISEGCEDEDVAARCNCTAEGLPCSPEGRVACADEETVATCIDGRWTLTDCADVCETGPHRGRCDPLLDPPSCAC